jgi:16S rRNA processing protein RimM
MKTIDRKAFVTIGKVLKTHGVNGELTIEHYKKPGKWAFLEIQGKPVPFKVDACNPTIDEQYIIKFQGIDSINEASTYNGYTLLALGKPGKVSVENDSIVGYFIIDKKLGAIGNVEDVIEMPMQWLIQTHFNERELLIPAVEPIVVSIDDDKKTLYVEMPDGLTD